MSETPAHNSLRSTLSLGAPSSGLAWSIWAVASFSALLQIFLELSSGDIVVGVMDSFSLDAAGVSLLLGVYYYTFAVLQIPAGFIIDRFGARSVLTVGNLICAGGCLLFATTEHLAIAVLGRFLMGVGSSFSFIGALYIARRWFPVRRFTFMVACTETMGMIGTIAGAGYMAFLVEHWGWREAMLGVAAVSLLVSLLVGVFTRNQPSSVAVTRTRLSLQGLWQEFKALVKTPHMWIIAIYTGLLFSVLMTFVSLWAIPYFQVAYGMSLAAAAFASNVAFLGVAVGGPLFGWIDSHTTYRRPLMAASALLSSGLLFLLIDVPHLPMAVVLIGMGLLGLFSSGYLIPFGISQEISPPQRQAAGNGFVSMSLTVTAPLLIQPLVGWILDLCRLHRGGIDYAIGDYQWALSILPVIVALAALLVYAVPRRRQMQLGL